MFKVAALVLSDEERVELLTLAAGSPLAAVSLQAQGVREQRALVVDGVKKLLKQQQSPTQLAEGWNAIPLLLLFDWFCDWSSLILRYLVVATVLLVGLRVTRGLAAASSASCTCTGNSYGVIQIMRSSAAIAPVVSASFVRKSTSSLFASYAVSFRNVTRVNWSSAFRVSPCSL